MSSFHIKEADATFERKYFWECIQCIAAWRVHRPTVVEAILLLSKLNPSLLPLILHSSHTVAFLAKAL